LILRMADLDFSDDEGEVPPLLGPDHTPTPQMPKVQKSLNCADEKVSSRTQAAANIPKTHIAGAGTECGPQHSHNSSRLAAPIPKPQAAAGTGLKKGFLSGGSKSSGGNGRAQAPANKGGESIPVLRGDSKSGASSLRMPEVQESIAEQSANAGRAAFGIGGDSWVTPDLLQKIAADPVLSKAFTDPRYADVMSAIQADPKAAMLRFGDSPEMQAFMVKFMKLMGDHFSKLAETQGGGGGRGGAARQAASEPLITPAKSKEEKLAEETAARAMADPEVVAILADVRVQAVLSKLQQGKSVEVEAEMRDPQMMLKLRKLSQVGLIGMQWRP